MKSHVKTISRGNLCVLLLCLLVKMKMSKFLMFRFIVRREDIPRF